MKNKLKIAILSIHSSPLGALGTKDTGGMSTYLLGLTKALGLSGHMVDIYTRAVAGTNHHVTEVSTNVRLISINDGLGPLCKYELADHAHPLAEIIEDFSQQNNLHYDLLFSHYWISGLVGQQLQTKWQLPHLLMFHTLGRAKNELCPGEKEPLERLEAEEKLAFGTDLLIVASQSERERLINYYSLDPDRVQVIPVGIDRNLFRPLDRSFSKEKIGLGTEKIILSVGRLEPVKGFELLLAATALIDQTLEYKVVIVGGDDQSNDLEEDLKKTADRLKLTDRIVFAGRAAYEVLPYYYNSAAVTVIPSFYESFGLVVLESLACNTPVVAGPVGVIPELAEISGSESHILVVPERNPVLWADLIREAITTEPIIAGAAADHLLKKFSWTFAAECFTDICHSLIENRL